ncbi:ArnT family glycosyltransferase [Rheinheimera fenheensis]|uniref:ArnT family glycosyltransferase n=1 Tax=Rheinheimera fenheensis TaxID=3152295 RepID=UPI00325D8474
MQLVRRFFIPLMCLAIVAILGSRLYLMQALPLFDTTEARYGEIARLMVDTQDWLIPQFNYNEPFLGEPPLHTWASALSMRFFGLSEWAVRLPHFLASLCVLWVTAVFVKHQAGVRAALFSVGVLSATPVLWVSSAMVMTDMLLVLGLTICMTNSWSLLSRQENKIGYASINIGIGLLIGMLAKGPLIIVLWVMTIGMFLLIQRRALAHFNIAPWAVALGIGVVLSAPWFIAVEIVHPGFLNYFFIGEHVLRFIDTGWEGDRYGTAHNEPLGTIWLFFVQGLFVWLLVALCALYQSIKKTNAFGDLNAFLLSWLLASPLLFTLAGNILPAYVLPSAVPVAALLTINLKTYAQRKFIIVMVAAFAVLLIALAINNQRLLTKKTDKFLLQDIKDDQIIVYDTKLTFSGRFYSNGRAVVINDLSELEKWLRQDEQYYWVSTNGPEHDTCQKVRSNSSKSLFECTKGDLP